MIAFVVQHISKLKVLFAVLVFPIMLISCGKSGNVKWVYYDETYCSDKWDYHVNNELLKENVAGFLKGKGVKVYEIEIFNDRTPDTCTDCSCKSGRRIKCKIKKREVKNVRGLGFYE